MTINGQQVTFDLDLLEDYEKYLKAMQVLTKRSREQGAIIELKAYAQFLRACLSKEDADSLLSDGRVSTIIRSFVDFFDQAVNQREEVDAIYRTMMEDMLRIKSRSALLAEGVTDLVTQLKAPMDIDAAETAAAHVS